MVIKLDVRQILHSRPRLLTHDLFAVANLLIYSGYMYIMWQKNLRHLVERRRRNYFRKKN